MAPFIIAEDANIEEAVNGLIQSKFRNAGQTCICANRIFVHETIEQPFLQAFEEAVLTLKVGNGMEGADLGPLIDGAAVKKVRLQLEDAASKGAIIHNTSKVDEKQGHFIAPAILSNVTDDMLCMQEETFGPIAPVSTFKTDQEAMIEPIIRILGWQPMCIPSHLIRRLPTRMLLNMGLSVLMTVPHPLPKRHLEA